MSDETTTPVNNETTQDAIPAGGACCTGGTPSQPTLPGTEVSATPVDADEKANNRGKSKTLIGRWGEAPDAQGVMRPIFVKLAGVETNEKAVKAAILSLGYGEYVQLTVTSEKTRSYKPVTTDKIQ